MTTFLTAINETDMEDPCFALENSVKVIIHPSNEMPTVFHDFDWIDIHHRLALRLTATTTRANEGLRKYSPEQRRCYFENERKLEFFKIYTKTHCNLECLTAFTLKKCGCVHFAYPRNDSTPVCDLKEKRCVWQALSDWPDKNETQKYNLPCNCLPTCSSIQYRIKNKQILGSDEKSSAIVRNVVKKRR